MGPTEICSLVIFALTLIATLSGRSLIKGLMAGVFGIFIACVGTDPLMGMPRMTLGFYQLSSGIPLTAIAIGMLALAEILLQIIEQQKKGYVETVIGLGQNSPKEDRMVSLNEFKGVFKTLVIGAFMVHGITPGPLMFETHGRLVYGIYFGMLMANILNLGLGYFGLKVFSRVLLAAGFKFVTGQPGDIFSTACIRRRHRVDDCVSHTQFYKKQKGTPKDG